MTISYSMTLVAKLSTPLMLLSVALVTACVESKTEPTQFHGATMGTTYNVTVPILPDGISKDELQAIFESSLKQVNQEMSTYQPDSLISEFNTSTSTDWFAVTESFVRVAQTAQELSKLSNGAYDITMAPLIKLWGFGSKNTENKIPENTDITSALSKIGYNKLSLQHEPFAIKKQIADVTINLSSIAKGFGVDVLAEDLEDLGVRNYLVEIGGELKASGESSRGDAWRIAVEKPVSGENAVHRVINLKDVAVATSGDYRNYFEKDGRRFSHMIDASTGSPITHTLASVTVLADSTMLADGWATALMLLGEEKGFELAKQQNLAAYFIYRQNSEFATKETQSFSKLVGEETN